jgi:hypothetical protein
VGTDRKQQQYQSDHERGIGDVEKAVGLLVGDCRDGGEHGQPSRAAEDLFRGGEHIADSEGHHEDQRPEAREAGQAGHHEDMDQPGEQHAGRDRHQQQPHGYLGHARVRHAQGARQDHESNAAGQIGHENQGDIGQPQARHGLESGGQALRVDAADDRPVDRVPLTHSGGRSAGRRTGAEHSPQESRSRSNLGAIADDHQ